MELSSSGFSGFVIFKIVVYGRFRSPYHIDEGLIIVSFCLILSFVFIDSLDFACSVEESKIVQKFNIGTVSVTSQTLYCTWNMLFA